MAKKGEIRQRIAEVAEVLCARAVVTENTIKGCTPEQIDEVEADVGVPLPVAYREFLVHMGRGAGRFYLGTDISYPTLLNLTRSARTLVDEDEAEIALPDDAIVFLMHQGYAFMFIMGDEGDDPPVYRYQEQSGEFEKLADAFTGFMIDVAHDDW